MSGCKFLFDLIFKLGLYALKFYDHSLSPKITNWNFIRNPSKQAYIKFNPIYLVS